MELLLLTFIETSVLYQTTFSWRHAHQCVRRYIRKSSKLSVHRWDSYYLNSSPLSQHLISYTVRHVW